MKKNVLRKLRTAAALVLKKNKKREFQKALADNITKSGIFHILPDRVYLKLVYGLIFGKKLNLKDPQTFNEKIQWLKLYDRKPEYSSLVDKYEVKSYVADKIGEEHIVPTLGVWDNFDDIDFDSLPNRFVIKCTHDSGSCVICKDKSEFDISKVREKINQALHRNLFYFGREWPYKSVKPRIIAEKYLIDDHIGELYDYKVFCFNGEPKTTNVCSGRHSEGGTRADFFDEQWNHLPIKRKGQRNANPPIDRPVTFEQMKEYARLLSKGFSFVRIDFYETNGRLYFGEITFYPASGFKGFDPDEWDDKLGKWIDLKNRDR